MCIVTMLPFHSRLTGAATVCSVLSRGLTIDDNSGMTIDTTIDDNSGMTIDNNSGMTIHTTIDDNR